MYKDIFTNDREVLFEFACIQREKPIRIHCILKEIIVALLNKYFLAGECHEFLFFNTVQREDHSEFFHLVYEQCLYDKGFLTWGSKKRPNFFVLWNMLTNLSHFDELRRIKKPALDKKSRGSDFVEINFIERFLLYIRLNRNLGMKHEIEKYDWESSRTLVTLYDIGRPEHFVTCCANKDGLKTVVLCHGVMPPFFDYRDLGSYNMYKIPSRYFLGQGENLVDMARKMGSSTQVIVCGNLKIRPGKPYVRHDVIGIAGSISAYHKDNEAMIQIVENYAREHGKKVEIRLHPGDSENDYEIDSSVSSFNRNIEDAELIVGYITAMIFTYMVLGKRVMRYDGALPYFDLPESIVFHDETDFSEKIDEIGIIDFRTIAKPYISYIGDESAKKYRDAFTYIHNC